MGIVCNTPKSAVNRYIEEATRIIAHQVMIHLERLGYECERRAKINASFTDRTGNLRSSIGSAVYDHGKQLMQSQFQMVMNGSEGTQKGKEYINSLAKLYAQTYALVVVAGMDYAEYVEAKNYDVLASTELWARQEIDKRLKQARQNAEQQILKIKL